MSELRGDSVNGYGVFGTSQNAVGMVGEAFSQYSAIWGQQYGTGNGVLGAASAKGKGVFGYSNEGFGVYGETPGNVVDNTAVVGQSNNYRGVEAFTNSPYQPALHARAGRNADGLAGWFEGQVVIYGPLRVTGYKEFIIDHPVDPQNKYLVHNAVESSEMKNVYDGVETLDANGEKEVDLPEWFEALNGDFRFQLTAVGGAAPNLHVAEGISESRFKIAGGDGGMKVCWQVTGCRKDPWAEANPFEVEEEKPQEARGRYLHPALYGAPEAQKLPIAPPIEEAERLPEGPPQPPEMMMEREQWREIDELRRQIEELRRKQ